MKEIEEQGQGDRIPSKINGIASPPSRNETSPSFEGENCCYKKKLSPQKLTILREGPYTYLYIVFKVVVVFKVTVFSLQRWASFVYLLRSAGTNNFDHLPCGWVYPNENVDVWLLLMVFFIIYYTPFL